jgi:hypothetical protein
MSPTENAPPGESRASVVLAPALLLTIIVLLVFGRALGGELVYDDLRLLAANPRVTGGVSLWESLSTSHWGFDDPTAEGRVGYWRPLTVLVLRWGWWLGSGAPQVLHALSLLLHVAASLAAWRFASLLLRDGRLGFIAALLFALHPVHVESVAWISAVNDPLYGLFVFLALGDWMRWRAGGGTGWALRPALWLLLGALAKEQALALIPVFLVIELALGPGGIKGKGWAPLAAALIVLWILRALVFGDGWAGLDRVNTNFEMGFARGASFRAEVFGGFVGLLALPWKLEVFRPFRPVLPTFDGDFYRALGWIALWAWGAALAWKRERRVVLALLCMVPASVLPILLSVDAAGSFPFSDRYLYVATIVPAALAVAGVAWVTRRVGRRALGESLVAVLALLLGLRSFTRTAIWHDEETLFRSAAAESPRSTYVHWGLGRVLLMT